MKKFILILLFFVSLISVVSVLALEQHTCSYCGGRGALQCNVCYGIGAIMTPFGPAPCYGCAGRGVVPCAACYGSGVAPNLNISTPSYSGYSSSTPSYSSSSDSPSSSSSSSSSRRSNYFKDNYGDKDCPQCHGTGTCQSCHGKGWFDSDFGGADIKCSNCMRDNSGNNTGKCSSCRGTGQVYGLKY